MLTLRDKITIYVYMDIWDSILILLFIVLLFMAINYASSSYTVKSPIRLRAYFKESRRKKK